MKTVLAIILIICSGIANAAEFSVGPKGYGIQITGTIRKGDSKRLNEFSLVTPRAGLQNVFLNSQGGDVHESLLIARQISDFLGSTWIESGSVCYSACTIIWAGGASRAIRKNAKLGFHRLSFAAEEVDVKKTKSLLDPVNREVTAFFKEVGFPALLIEKMNETPPSDLYLVDSIWLVEHELDFSVRYQPTFLDVVERSCGADPSAASIKRDQRLTKLDEDRFKKWLDCGDEIREINRNKRFAEFMKEKSKKGYVQPKSSSRPSFSIP
ncbi:MAG: hypothetical protein Q7J80_00350 [Anaerolineales bacterium]|nr:hypothetical protein [Anaerolineales bacterium]